MLPAFALGSNLLLRDHPVTVVGIIHYVEDGETWTEFLVEGFPVSTWLSYDEDQLMTWSPRPDLAGTTPPRRTRLDGVKYSRDEVGEAEYRAEGRTDTAARGSVQYMDLEGDDGSVLSWERFDGGDWEVSLGRRIPLQDLRSA